MNGRDRRIAAIRMQALDAVGRGDDPWAHACPSCAEARAMLVLADVRDRYLSELADPATGRYRSQRIKQVLAIVDERMSLLDTPAASTSVH